MTKTYDDFFKHLEKVACETTLSAQEKLSIRQNIEARLGADEALVTMRLPETPSPASPTPTA